MRVESNGYLNHIFALRQEQFNSTALNLLVFSELSRKWNERANQFNSTHTNQMTIVFLFFYYYAEFYSYQYPEVKGSISHYQLS